MTTTQVFATPGTQQFTVPPGVTSITVDVQGAGGGNTAGFVNGGKGTRIQATVAVTPGQVLQIKTGGIPPASNAANFHTLEGGPGGHANSGDTNPGGSGGDCSWVGLPGPSGQFPTPWVVAAGGGGAGAGNKAGGNGGGITGSGGNGALGSGSGTPNGSAGQGASTAAGGAGGNGSFNSSNGGPGFAVSAVNNGGADAEGAYPRTSYLWGGGAGGGGYYGGGAGFGDNSTGSGAGGGGGGGGSSYAGAANVSGVTVTTGYVSGGQTGQVTLTYNQPPNAPTLQSPANNYYVDPTAAIPVSWQFSDPDASDTQSKADVRWAPTGSSSWTTIASAVTGAGTTYNFPANTFTNGQQIQWQVQTYDSSGVASGWSASNVMNMATAPAAPTITAPAAASTISTNPFTVSWTTPVAQQGYQIKVTSDSAGNTVLYDSGATVSGSQSVQVPADALPQGSNNVYVWVRYQQFSNSAIWSPWASSGALSVNTQQPPIPTLTLTPDNTNGKITVAINNGTGTYPATSNDVYRTDVTRGDPEIRVATGVAAGGSYVDYFPASGRQYRYRVVAFAAGGGHISSA